MTRNYFAQLPTVVIASLVLLLFCIVVSAESTHNTVGTPQAKDYLVFGFLPMESPVSLFKRFAPFRDYLSTQLQREIRLETAKDFQVFANRTANRHYDIVFTAPHLALPALDSDRYEIAATFTEPLKSVIVVKNTSQLKSIEDLQSKIVATPPKQAIVTMVGINFFTNNNIQVTRFDTYQTHNAAYAAVLGNQADAAMVANFIAMKAIAHDVPLKIIAQSEPFPGIGILIARDLPENLRQDIKKVIWSMKELPNGKKVLKKISQPGYVEAEKNQFEVLRPFVQAALP